MKLHVEVAGNGTALALLHGWGLHGGIWAPLREALQRHFTLHIVDLPGHGYSSGIGVTSLASLAQTVAAALPEHCHLCGWSLGGQVAMRIAIDSPQRVEKLALVAATPRFTNGGGWMHGIDAQILEDFSRRMEGAYERTLVNFLGLQTLHDAGAKSLLRTLRATLFERGEPHRDALRAGLALLHNTDLRDSIAAIKAETLVVHGDRDMLVPARAGEWLAAHIAQAKYYSFERSGHIPFLSHPERFTSVLCEFLEAEHE